MREMRIKKLIRMLVIFAMNHSWAEHVTIITESENNNASFVKPKPKIIRAISVSDVGIHLVIAD